MSSALTTARPATAAIAWCTPRELFVEIPSRVGLRISPGSRVLLKAWPKH